MHAGADATRKAGLYSRVLKAFRNGELGRYTLDELPVAPAATAAPPPKQQRPQVSA